MLFFPILCVVSVKPAEPPCPAQLQVPPGLLQLHAMAMLLVAILDGACGVARRIYSWFSFEPEPVSAVLWRCFLQRLGTELVPPVVFAAEGQQAPGWLRRSSGLCWEAAGSVWRSWLQNKALNESQANLTGSGASKRSTRHGFGLLFKILP